MCGCIHSIPFCHIPSASLLVYNQPDVSHVFMATNGRPIHYNGQPLYNDAPPPSAAYQESQEPLISVETLRAIRHVTSYPGPDAIIDQCLRRKISCQNSIDLVLSWKIIMVYSIHWYINDISCDIMCKSLSPVTKQPPNSKHLR